MNDVPPGSVIDGFGIGEQHDCPPDADPGAECLTYVEVATTGLDERDPAHMPVVRVTLHYQLFLWDDGSLSTATCSGGCMDVAVFYLVDGSLRAIAVGTPGVSTEAMTIPYGSINRPEWLP